MSSANPAGVILAYHRIDCPRFDRWTLSVSPRNFAEQLEVMTRVGVPIRLDDMAGGLLDKSMPDRCVAITFDDGYTNNLTEGKELLERYECPATLFLCSGLIGSPDEFWWDELEFALFSGDPLPEQLKLSVDGVAHRWDSASCDGGESRRIELHDKIWQVIRAASPAARQSAIEQVRRWAGGTAQRRGYRPMGGDEIDEMLSGGLVTVGSHTVSHCLLSEASREQQLREMVADREALEARFGRQVDGVAYPHGGYNRDTLEIVEAEAFAYACTTKAGLVSYGESPLALPRICPGDWSGDKLMSELRSYGWAA